MTRAPGTGPGLARVVIASGDLDRHRGVYAAIVGTPLTPEPGDASSFAAPLGASRVTLIATRDDTAARGIRPVTVTVPNLAETAERLMSASVLCRTLDPDHIVIDAEELTGVTLELCEADAPAQTAIEPNLACRLDHLAIAVTDLDDAVRRWWHALGVPPDMFGVHPLGGVLAARFLLGHQMIELAAPLDDDDDAPIRPRLRRAGEGPFALALVATDLAAARGAVSATGARADTSGGRRQCAHDRAERNGRLLLRWPRPQQLRRTRCRSDHDATWARRDDQQLPQRPRPTHRLPQTHDRRRTRLCTRRPAGAHARLRLRRGGAHGHVRKPRAASRVPRRARHRAPRPTPRTAARARDRHLRATYTAEDYLALGLINRIADAGTLDDATTAFVEPFNELAPYAVRRTGEVFRIAKDSDMRGLLYAGDQLNHLLTVNGQLEPLFTENT